MNISAVVLTKNEEKNIEICLKSLDFCDEIIVIDDYSEDKTIEKVHKVFKVNKVHKVFKRKLDNNFSQQKNFGLEKASNQWVLFVDADEEISKELKEEILNLDPCQNIVAFYIKRRDFFWGREVRFGEVLKARKKGFIRLVKKNSGFWSGKVHEEFKISIRQPADQYQILNLKYFINHYPHQSLKEFLEEINFYSTLRARELYQSGKKTNILEIVFYPLGKFLLNYFFYLGFLDGAVGFVYAFLMSFHSFLVRAKVYQYQIEET